MIGALSWLNDLVQWLGRWVPRLVLIEPTHRGVRFGPHGSAVPIPPGLTCYWPIAQNLVLVPVTTQSIQITTQILPTRDEHEDAIVPRVRLAAVAVQFRVQDAVAFAVRALHAHALVDNLVDNRTQAAIARNVDKAGDLVVWAQAAAAQLEDELKGFGVHLERLDFTQTGTGVAIKNVADWSYADSASGKRPE